MRTIAILTGTRADYGLLRPLIEAVRDDPRLQLALVVSGSHLMADLGQTVAEIEAQGIEIAARVPIWSGDDSAVAAANDTGRAVGAYAETLHDLAPDVVVVLGDRLEALAMALAATVVGVPVAHVHGGELTEGAMDDALRHSISKLSFLHFTTTDEHRARVVQLGEQPERVYNLGAPVLDAISTLELLDAPALAERFGVTLADRTVLMTYHPAAFDVLPSGELLRELLAALELLPDARIIITGTNNDIGSDEVRAQLGAFVAAHHDRVDHVESFGQLGYLSVMSLVGVVTGNSSSTVLEAPLLGIPSVLVGDRQAGRPLSAGVIVPAPTRGDILEALERALTPEFRASSAAAGSVFGTPGFAARAVEILATTDIPRPTRKRFADLPVPEGK